jgi:hypothetical protein
MKNIPKDTYKKTLLDAIRNGKVDEVQNLVGKHGINIKSFRDDNATIDHNMVYFAAEYTKDDYR